MVEITFLGTASAFPTASRNHPSVYVSLGGAKVLLDCGEGTQRQIRRAGLSPAIDYIFITHWHGDHSLGVGGILQSLNMINRREPLFVYGPAGTNSRMAHLSKTYQFHSAVKVVSKPVDAPKESVIASINDYDVYALNVKHAVKCLAYKIKERDTLNLREDLLKKYGIKPDPILKRLKEGKDAVYNGRKLPHRQFTYVKKGRSVVYVTDLAYSDSVGRFARDADALVIEATFSSSMGEKAGSYFHLTVEQALKIAKRAGAKKVYLVHTSQRYENDDALVKEAAAMKEKLELGADVFFPNDLDKIEI